MSKVNALILSAGLSSRFNSFKPLLKINNEYLINIIIKKLLSLELFEKIVVVLGNNNEILKKYININSEKLYLVFNENFKEGMFSSIKKGISSHGENDVMLFTVDMPFFKKSSVVKIYKKGSSFLNKAFVCPSFLGKPGHPLYIKKNEIQKILNNPNLKSLRDLLNNDNRKLIKVDDEGVLFDIDTREDLNYVKNSLIFNEGRENYFIQNYKLSSLRKIIFIRHGQQINMGRKTFIGQYDLPLSKNGGISINNLINRPDFLEKIKALKNPIIVSGNLKRHRTSADLISKKLNLKSVKTMYFNEINLGILDGKSIDDFKVNNPKEYEKRGIDIVNYKIPKGENFIDLKYRVFKGLRKLNEFFPNNDIILVSSLGVYQVLYSLIFKEKLTTKYINECNLDYSEYVELN